MFEKAPFSHHFYEEFVVVLASLSLTLLLKKREVAPGVI